MMFDFFGVVSVRDLAVTPLPVASKLSRRDEGGLGVLGGIPFNDDDPLRSKAPAIAAAAGDGAANDAVMVDFVLTAVDEFELLLPPPIGGADTMDEAEIFRSYNLFFNSSPPSFFGVVVPSEENDLFTVPF